MRRLVFSELKKLFKSRFHILLLLGLLLYTGYATYQTYNKYPNTGRSDWEYTDVDGTRIKRGLDYYRRADQILHQYKGIANEELYQTYRHDYQSILDQFPQETFDDTFMTKMYGKDYDQFLKNARDGKYNNEQLWEEIHDREIYGSWANEDNHFYFDLYYENDHVRTMYQMIYLNTLNFSSYDPALEEPPMDVFTENFYQLCTNDKTSLSYDELRDQGNTTDAAMKEKLIGKDLNKSFDSPVGNNLLINALGNINVMTLIVIAMILSNSFSMEAYYKTNQILIPSATAMKKLTIAKLLSGILVALAILCFQYVIVFGLSFLFLPCRDLGMLTIDMAGTSLINVTSSLFTYQEMIVSNLLLNTTAVVSLAVVTMALSFFTKNRFATIVPLLIVLLVTSLLLPFQQLMNSFLDHFFWGNMMDTTSFYSGFISYPLPYVLILGTLFSWKTLILLFWIIATVVIVTLMYRISKNHVVKNQ